MVESSVGGGGAGALWRNRMGKLKVADTLWRHGSGKLKVASNATENYRRAAAGGCEGKLL